MILTSGLIRVIFPKIILQVFKVTKTKTVPGKFKDKAGGKIIEEFVGLRAKLYSFKMFEGKEINKCKGVNKSTIKSSISHQDFLNCLKSWEIQYRNMHCLRSYEHIMFDLIINKIALSANDDKRYIIDSDKINTNAWGHYKIPKDVNIRS